MTLEKIVVNFNQREFTPGLCYVATSRVKDVRGLMLEETVTLDHL